MFLFISPSCRERIINKHLNTSHVLIYPMRQNRVYILPSFKYISCSYLSGAIPRNMKRIGLFKYISCSYLSGISKIIGGSQSYLNTSHVLIYLERNAGHKGGKKPFKYISCSYLSNTPVRISKLFII